MPQCIDVKKVRGIRVRSVLKDSVLYKAGVRKRAIILSVNGERVVDELDFTFFAATDFLQLEVLHNGIARSIEVEREPGSFLGIDFYQKPTRRCANRCIFCFIDQMPPGLRRSLYIKDEDLSHSFLNGNYVTLSNASRAMLEKAVAIGLSPLFISVHATDPLVRLRMLGIKKAAPIMEQLLFLRDNGISFHTQIVVCPGYNDGAILTRTVKDLFTIGKSLLSIAVVPVGLTRFRAFPLDAVITEKAKEVCAQIGVLSDRDAAKNGTRRLFLADEFFLKANMPVPGRKYYEDYPQIENGVGLVRRLIEEWNTAVKKFRGTKKERIRRRHREKEYLVVTSVSAFSTLEKIARECERLRPGTIFHIEAATNCFFGPSVTVAGLLTAGDVVGTIKASMKKYGFDRVLLPPVMFNYAGFTLDGFSAKRVAKMAGVAVSLPSSMEELLYV
jgi:putative radical SAM enzyme (TIGR03279 family)